jgi:hypothetical protein
MRNKRLSKAKVRFHHIGIVIKNISEAISKYTAAPGRDKGNILLEEMSYITGKGEI